jgi:hypothetical protein
MSSPKVCRGGVYGESPPRRSFHKLKNFIVKLRKNITNIQRKEKFIGDLDKMIIFYGVLSVILGFCNFSKEIGYLYKNLFAPEFRHARQYA